MMFVVLDNFSLLGLVITWPPCSLSPSSVVLKAVYH